MKIVIPGGTGQVGTILARSFHKAGHEVLILGRNPKPQIWRFKKWDAESAGEWTQEIDGADLTVRRKSGLKNIKIQGIERREMTTTRII